MDVLKDLLQKALAAAGKEEKPIRGYRFDGKLYHVDCLPKEQKTKTATPLYRRGDLFKFERGACRVCGNLVFPRKATI